MKQGRRNRHVSSRQLEVLWEFLNSNKDLLATYNSSTIREQHLAQKWKEIAKTLNSEEDGAYKNHMEWCKYWSGYMARIKYKVSSVRVSCVGIGGRPTIKKRLPEIQEKFLLLMSEPETISNVRVELPPETTASTSVQDSPTPASLQLSHSNIHNPLTNDVSDEATIMPLPSPIMVQEPPDRSSNGTPTRPSCPTTQELRRRRRRRRIPFMNIETARQALVGSTQMHAKAVVRIADILEHMAHTIAKLSETAVRVASAPTAHPTGDPPDCNGE